MKILVPIKRVPDPEMKIKLADGKPDLSNATWVVNTFDEYAVEASLRLTENGDTGDRHGEVVVITLGPEEAGRQLRSSLAMGADRAIHIASEDADIDAGMVARALAKVVEQEKPDLVILGKQAVDGDASQVGPMLAGILGWPQATFAAFLDLAKDERSITVGREVDGGVEYKRLTLPGLVSVDLRVIQPKAVLNHVTPDSHEYQDGPRYASLKGIMKAKKKPMDNKTLGDLGVEAVVVTKDGAYELPAARAAGVIVEDVPALIKKLVEEAKVL